MQGAVVANILILALGALYFYGFFHWAIKLRRMRRNLDEHSSDERRRWNRLIRKFPASMYAKMFGAHTIDAPALESKLEGKLEAKLETN